jgi:hypothetical protein
MSSAGNGNSSSSQGLSSAGNGNSSAGGNGSSNSNGGSSDSNGGSSGSNSGSSDSNGGNSSAGGNGSSDSNGGSSGSNGGSSGSNGGNSSGNDSGNSSSGEGGNGEDEGDKSSSSEEYGAGEDENDKSSSSWQYFGAEDYDEEDDTGLDEYPSADDFEKGDSLVSKTVVLQPTTPDPKNPNIVVINGNSYLLTNDPKGIKMDLHYNSGLDSAKVGDVVAITFDSKKVKQYFGSPDSIRLVSKTGVLLVDPTDGSKNETLVIHPDGSVTVFVTADKVVQGGSIKVYGGNEMVIIDNINFYDPIPDAQMGYIKDSDGDMELDYVEILLKDTLSENYFIDGVQLVINGKTLDCVNPTLNKARDRIIIDVSNLKGIPAVGEFPKDAKALVTYGSDTDATYVREAAIVEVGSNVIKDAFAIRNTKGYDSLFVQYNIDLIPVDIGIPEMMVMLKQEAARYGFDVGQIKKVYMPAKDIIIFVGKNFKLKGNYSFQYAKDVVIRNADMDTKDAFWEAEDVTVYDSRINGEYLGWYSKNLHLVNCKIGGTQPLCYCENLVLENCVFEEDADLAFEYSDVEASIIGPVTSVKNPRTGRINADSYGEVVLDGNIKAPADCEIRTWDAPDVDLAANPDIVEY